MSADPDNLIHAAPHVPGALPDRLSPCAGCGYDLRTLSTSGRCPECGLLILKSLRAGPELSLADFSILRGSTSMILAANIVGLPALLATYFLGGVRPAEPGAIASAALFLACVIFRTLGYVRLAQIGIPPGPGARNVTPERAIRIAAWCRAVLAVLIALSLLSSLAWSDPLDIASIAVALLASLYIGVGVGQFFAVMTFMESVGLRSRRRHLAALPTWLGTACAVAVLPGALIMGLGVPLAWVLYHVFLDRFRAAAAKRIREELAAPAGPGI